MGGEGIHNPADIGDIETNLETALAYLIFIYGEVAGLDGDAMRGTDNAALATNWTAALATALGNYTAARAGYLDELAAANIPADIDTLLARLTALRAGYLDELGPTNIPADIDTLLARLTAIRAGYLDELGPTNLPSDIDDILTDTTEIVADVNLVVDRQIDMLGLATTGRAVTATLCVSPDGDDTDGLTWRTAFTTIQGAIDAASGDAADLTLLLIALGSYDINTTGDPSYFKNLEIRGSHRNWVMITNDHGSATSIMNFTGYVSLRDLTFDMGTGSLDGVKISGAGSKGSRVRCIYFEAEHTTGAHTCLELEDTEYARVEDVKWHGTVGNTLGLLLDDCKLCNFEKLDFHECLTGIQITDTSPDNIWTFILLHECDLALDIDGGDNQFFHEFAFVDNTRNVHDDVLNHVWLNPHGAFEIEVLPDNLIGVAVTGGGAGNTYGADTEILAAASRANPFRIVGVSFAPDASPAEWYMVRFSADSGSTFYDILIFKGDKREGTAAPSGTEFVFNAGTRISCSAKSASGGNDVNVWIEVQEI